MLLDIGGRKQRAVLAVLLTSLNRVVSLDRLIDELWGDDAPPRATGTLQAYISNLRRVLEPDRAPRTPPQVLATQPPGYVLRADPGQVDAVRFETLTADAVRRLDEEPAEARRMLDEALGLWRGPALAEFASEPFARNEAQRLENLRELALETKAAAALALGDSAAVVGDLERLVAEHPLRERLWELLMLALYRAGRQAESLRTYSEARRVLLDELGVSPGPSLQAMEAAVLAQSPSLDWRPAPTTSSAATASTLATVATGAIEGRPADVTAGPDDGHSAAPSGGEPSVIDLRTAADHLVGRDEQLARLTQALADAVAGHTRLTVVSGPPGIGKTSLVDAFATIARADGAAVAWSRGVDEQGAPALWPWAQVLRELLAGLPPGAERELLGERSTDLAQVLPQLAAHEGAAERPVAAPEFARFRVYESITALLGAISAAHPIVVVLDDFQWADLTSVRLLEFLSGELREARALIVVACRDDVPADHPLAQCLATLARQPVTDRLTLGGLDEASVQRYVHAVAGTDVPDRVTREVYRRTAGNPFFVAELVRLLASEGRLDEHGAAGALPAGVRDVIRQRIARLPEDTQSLLLVAAVIGQAFTLDVLQEVSSLNDDRLFELIEAALVTGVLVEAAEFGRYEFAHALVRDTLYTSLTTVRRARLHAAVAAILQRAADRDATLPAADLARHWHAAGDRRRALEASLRAARQAVAVVGFEDAAEHYERALSLWSSVADADAATGCAHVELLLEAADACCYAGRDRRAEELAAAALAQVDRDAAPAEAATTLERLGRYAWLAGDTAAAFRAYEDAVDLLAPLPPSVEQARVLAAHGQALMVRSLYEQAVARCREAIAVALQVGARAAEGHARNSLGSCLATLGWVDEGLAELEEARRIAVELDRPDDLCRALANRSTRLLAVGRSHEGVAAALSAVETARRYGMFGVYGTFVAANAGFALVRIGRWDEADAITAEALREQAPERSTLEVMLARADLEIRRGNPDRAEEWLDDVEHRMASLESVSLWGELLIARTEVALLQHDAATASAIVDRALELVNSSDDEMCGPELIALGTRAAAERATAAREAGAGADADAAAADSRRLVDVLHEFLSRAAARGTPIPPTIEGFALLAEAEAARAEGDPAPGRWAEAARCWERVGYPHLIDYARARAGEESLL